ESVMLMLFWGSPDFPHQVRSAASMTAPAMPPTTRHGTAGAASAGLTRCGGPEGSRSFRGGPVSTWSRKLSVSSELPANGSSSTSWGVKSASAVASATEGLVMSTVAGSSGPGGFGGELAGRSGAGAGDDTVDLAAAGDTDGRAASPVQGERASTTCCGVW